MRVYNDRKNTETSQRLGHSDQAATPQGPVVKRTRPAAEVRGQCTPAGMLSLKTRATFILWGVSESRGFRQHLLNVSFAIQHVKSSALPANSAVDLCEPSHQMSTEVKFNKSFDSLSWWVALRRLSVWTRACEYQRAFQPWSSTLIPPAFNAIVLLQWPRRLSSIDAE